MKDYTFNNIEKKDFIIKYLIENDKLIVKYADINRKDDVFYYTKEKELEILNKMEKQVNNYQYIKNKLEGKIKHSKLWLIPLGSIICLNIHSILKLNSIVSYFSLIFTSLVTIINFFVIKEDITILKNLEKTKFYLDNKDILNSNVKKYSKNKDNNISLNKELNVNLLDNYSIEMLKKIKDDSINNEKKSKRLILEKKKIKNN